MLDRESTDTLLSSVVCAAFNGPLPGDLIIVREHVEGSVSLRDHATFIVAVYPEPSPIRGPYQSFAYALTRARELAAERRVQIWRDAGRQLFEQVS